MKIKTRINLALGVVLTLHLSTAIMGHVGLERSQSDFINYKAINSDTIKVLSIDKSIAELQRNISMYMLSGNTSTGERVRQLIGDIQSDLQQAKLSTGQESVSDLLNSMFDRVDIISDDFEKVSLDRGSRTKLVDERMSELKSEITSYLNASTSYERHHKDAILTQISEAESTALRYFRRPERSYVTGVIAHLERAEQTAIDQIGANTSSPLIGLIDQYEQSFLRAVQSTRSYLHLVNVVLAGHTYELLHESTTIKEISLQEQDSVEDAMQLSAGRFQLISNLVAFVTVVFGFVAAGMIVRKVVGPIQGITATLLELARGKQTTEVLHTERNDEIGSMAKAAEVFRLKNIETNTLLEQSRVLGESLELQNTEMTQFVYTVSHDLKSPLVTIHGFSGMLTDMIDSQEYEEAKEVVHSIESATIRMSKTIHDLLELSRVGLVVQAKQEIDFQALSREVVHDLDAIISQENAQVTILGDDQIIIADEVRIRQIVQNLINNAIVHAAPESGHPRVIVELEEHETEQVISVSDNGPGVKPEYREKIFGLFQQLTDESNGTGVGLTIIKKIAESHNGRAWVETSELGGAVFKVSIARAVAESPILAA